MVNLKILSALIDAKQQRQVVLVNKLHRHDPADKENDLVFAWASMANTSQHGTLRNVRVACEVACALCTVNPRRSLIRGLSSNSLSIPLSSLSLSFPYFPYSSHL